MTVLKIDDENEIYYELVLPKDNGCTFVFVNALTGNVSAWNGEIGQQVIAQGNGYLTYNFRGQEKSKFNVNLSLDTEIIVSDLCLLINKLKIQNIVLVGLSIGGLYATLALEKGVKSLGLVLINTLRKNNLRLNWINETMVNVARYGGISLLMDFNMPVVASPRFLEQMKPSALNPNNYIGLEENSGIFKLMKGSLSANWDVDWSKINIPVLIMTGHHDKVFRIPNDIDDIVNRINNTKRVELSDCGHLIPIEKPKEFADYINKFVKNLA
ncbi:alpha/beta hydrolase [Alphaproteobacteria bacterium]|nr:alpha/beta hydrolase [Alphaproteobacteria bacterium]